MALKDLEFSDLLLTENGEGRLRGVPGKGVSICSLPADCADEAKALPGILANQWLQKKDATAIRYIHDGVVYRVSRAADVMSGQCWFLRKMPTTVPQIEDLGVPPHIAKWLVDPQNNHGLVLFSGSQGSGKTTLASALLKTRLMMYGGLAVTFESPAEMPLSGYYGDIGQCIQTEVTSESDLPMMIQRAHTFAQPNIIFIGEIKSAVAAMEALRAALGSREQMVVATIHGVDIVSALQRLMLWGQELEGANAAMNLSMTLSTIVQLVLDSEGSQKQLRIPEFLLVPFTGEFSTSVRTKIRTGAMEGLKGEITRNRNMMLHGTMPR